MLDGLPCEFYKAMRDMVGDDFFCLATEAFPYEAFWLNL